MVTCLFHSEFDRRVHCHPCQQADADRVREDELLYVLRHVVTLRISGKHLETPSNGECGAGIGVASDDADCEVSGPVKLALEHSQRAHLFALYALLLRLSFTTKATPSKWLFPTEYRDLFEQAEVNVAELDIPVNGDVNTGAGPHTGEQEHVDAGDGADLIEVSARDLARRALELIGNELGLGNL